jgi:nitroimidazol reductase NimA-like FMN-containing flavoprotein (pyridoxamine 5'-phosphate oxidase superfamily)
MFMRPDNRVLDSLTRDECLRLLASVPVGRIVYTRRAMPAVELVNFTVDGGDIVVRTDAGGKLAAATHGAVVAFEADELDLGHRRGWSVTAVGYAREVTDPDDLARLRRVGPRPWAPGEREHFIQVTPGILTGRRLS